MYRNSVRIARMALALASVVGFLALSAPASWGAPEETDTTLVDAPTMTLSSLGYNSVLSFYGLQGTQQLTIPAPHGLKPTALNATAVLPVNLRSGLITVTQNDREIARVNLPAADQSPIVIPLADATVVDDAVTVILRAYLVPLEDLCVYPWSPFSLVNGSVSFVGVERPPVTVAHFLPPVLRRLSIFVPPSPSVAESDAVVQLAAAAAAHYGKQAPEIAVVRLPEGELAPPAPPRPLERQVVIKEGQDEGLSLRGATGVPWLLISGPLGSAAESSITLLFSSLSQLALASKAVVGSFKPSLHLPGDTITLRELGQPGLNSVGLQPRVTIGLDQTRFARSVHSMRVHLQGSYSPIPPSMAGQIVATIGAETIDRWPTESSGVIDRWVDVPDRLLQRWTGVDLTLDVSGNVGRCGDFYTAGAGDHVLTLTIDGDTAVQSSPAAPPVPDGLRSVPQALVPQIQVGIEEHSFDDTARAVRIVVGLQRTSSVPLQTTVTSVQQAIDSSKSAILIAADGWNHADIVLPVSAGPGGPITINAVKSDGKPATLTLDPALRFASLQTVFQHGRSLLVATSNGAPEQLDGLLGWLDGDSARWPGIRGVALVAMPGQDPVVVERPNAGSVDDATSEQRSGSGWIWWFGGAWLVAAVVGAGVILFRSRLGPLRRR